MQFWAGFASISEFDTSILYMYNVVRGYIRSTENPSVFAGRTWRCEIMTVQTCLPTRSFLPVYWHILYRTTPRCFYPFVRRIKHKRRVFYRSLLCLIRSSVIIYTHYTDSEQWTNIHVFENISPCVTYNRVRRTALF